MSEYVSNPEEAKDYAPRYRIFYLFIAITFFIFGVRLWYLQVISGSELRRFSEQNRIKQAKIQAPRGLILDRYERSIVENLPGFEAIVYPQYIEDIQALAQIVGPILNFEVDKVLLKIERSKKQNGNFTPIRLKENLSRIEVFRLKRVRLDVPGLEIRESVVRAYPLIENGAQLFGYVGEISKEQLKSINAKQKDSFRFEQGDLIGKSGLEGSLDREIRGVDGIAFVQVDAHGRETTTQTPNIYGEQIRNLEPQHGNNAILTIDRDIQEAAYKSMQTHQRTGGVIAMRSNGEILAWVNSPSFDSNELSNGPSSATLDRIKNDPLKPFRNKVIQDIYPPGSTFKPLIAVVALQEKEITPTKIINAPGVFVFARRPYHDHLKGGHGNITVMEAIERSSNVFFYKMGIALGVDKIFDYLSLFNLGSKTQIEVAGESAGSLPNSKWKKIRFGEDWQPGENLSTAVGQGFVVATPLQMAVAYNTIATEGKVVKPFIVKKIQDQTGKDIREMFPQVVRDLTQKQSNGVIISPETFKTVKEALRRVVHGDRGTAKSWKVPGVIMAGKTGTAQVMEFSAEKIYQKCENQPLKMRHHGWFIGFAPYDNPEITVAALTEHSCHGSSGAAPIVRDIIQAYYQKYHPGVVENALKNKKNVPAPTPTPEETTEGE